MTKLTELEKTKMCVFLTCIYRFAKFPLQKIFDRANARNFHNLLRQYVECHRLPSAIILHQDKCQIREQRKTILT